jgi:putative hydrolase of the HAD superfamily
MKLKFATAPFEVIAFDADDTLWHNEYLYLDTHEKFKQLLRQYHHEEWIEQRLNETEIRNLRHFGYGIKGFTLSMIETAIELSEGRMSGAEIQAIIEFGKEMTKAPVELLDGVRETIAKLAESYELMLITKGDLFDQEAKIARSGLGDYFSRIEVVSEKNAEIYQKIVAKHGIAPERFLMVGNSLKSDILPVIAIGGHAVLIPYRTTWIHERVSLSDLEPKSYIELEQISFLPNLLDELNNAARSHIHQTAQERA